ncbi:hypothetical protein [Mycolicibacterium wolinskyi]|uniref:hypothetical protein n=1 Tax=Mycolicibacterium wolinskyi TaxID=59750 RepID=UPI0039178E99
MLLMALTLSSCRSGESAPPPPTEPAFANWPQTLDGFRFRWTAEPGIDLLSGPAVPLRAYLESHRVGDLTSNVDDAYPGFSRAVPAVGKAIDESSSRLPFQLWDIQPATEPALVHSQPTRFFGNEYLHILNLASTEGGGYRAYVCDGLYNIFRENAEPHEYVPVYAPTEDDPDVDAWAVKVWRVELTETPPTPDAPDEVATPQKGPNPAPLGDVFGPWRITGASPNTSWGATDGSDANAGADPALPQLKQQCRDRMPHDAAQRHAIYTSRLDTPPTPEPAVPGWPDNVV